MSDYWCKEVCWDLLEKVANSPPRPRISEQLLPQKYYLLFQFLYTQFFSCLWPLDVGAGFLQSVTSRAGPLFIAANFGMSTGIAGLWHTLLARRGSGLNMHWIFHDFRDVGISKGSWWCQLYSNLQDQSLAFYHRYREMIRSTTSLQSASCAVCSLKMSLSSTVPTAGRAVEIVLGVMEMGNIIWT